MKALVAIDDSEGSLYALQWVLDNLFNTGESPSPNQSGTLVLLHVQQLFQHFIYPSGPVVYATTAMVDTMKKALEENSARVIARAIELIYKSRPCVQVKLESLIVHGDPKEMICEVADKIQPDVVVVGSRGLGKIKRAFLGSVSDYCAHHVHCPVLIVKPPK
ncbi:universal stress protein A-like protein [Aristolochia californica]|uniref:universal stress protein A-like protein n=1 Tax=Aristolochia californica TaxID=171875 RepID=UPI0035D69B20